MKEPYKRKPEDIAQRTEDALRDDVFAICFFLDRLIFELMLSRYEAFFETGHTNAPLPTDLRKSFYDFGQRLSLANLINAPELRKTLADTKVVFHLEQACGALKNWLKNTGEITDDEQALQQRQWRGAYDFFDMQILLHLNRLENICQGIPVGDRIGIGRGELHPELAVLRATFLANLHDEFLDAYRACAHITKNQIEMLEATLKTIDTTLVEYEKTPTFEQVKKVQQILRGNRPTMLAAMATVLNALKEGKLDEERFGFLGKLIEAARETYNRAANTYQDRPR